MRSTRRMLAIVLVTTVGVLHPTRSSPADHNDPNAVNSIFSDVKQDAADLYDMFGFPVDDGRRVVLALTFSAVPRAGQFDTDMLYRILLAPNPRAAPPMQGDRSLDGRVTFFDFPGGAINRVIDVNKPQTVRTSDGSDINIFVGGRDDAFFNDLPGFFRSINYAPQFYHVPHTTA